MARMTVKRNFSFAKVLDDLQPSEADMREAGEQLAVKIENRTLAGLDEDGRRFAPYARGRRKFGKRAVDLHDTGRMFQDFGVVKATRRMFALGFRSRRSERIADWLSSGTSRMPARRFLGVPASWIDDLIRTLKRQLR